MTTGVPYQMQDGAGMTVNVSTDGSTANSLPSVLTPNSNGNLATSMTYSSAFTLASVTGANGATQSTIYDVFNRPNSSTSVDGATTNYAYSYTTPGSPSTANTQSATISTTVNSTTTTLWKITTFDGFGRPIRVQTGHDGVAIANVDTQYGACGCSPLGKMTETSMPYAPGATVYWTTNTYDGSGRTLTQTKPDGSVTTTSYAGNAVTMTDPAGKWKTYYSDIAGGLTTVVEPNPGNATNPVTYYYLNGAGQITQVSVQRNGVAQNRTFMWSGSDMTSSTTPEAGTVTYTYDGNHHVVTRTDAKSQQTQYTYDAYERLTQVNHSTYGLNPQCSQNCLPGLIPQPSQQVNYAYDTNPLDGNYSQYSWGRLTAVSFTQQIGNGNSFYYMYSYNQAGRVTGNRLTAVDTGSNLLTDLKATYAWDNQGRMTNQTYPSGTSLAYQYDAMSRLSGITQNGTAIATATYTAASQLNTLQYPNYAEQHTYNILMQITHLTVNGTGSVDMQYNYTAGQNNGRVSQTTDGVLGETVNYGYDMWNRLTSATATNGSWGEGYTFDGFGNLTGKTPTAGSAPAMNAPADPATNRQSGGSYDANGNPIGGNVWDVENRLIGTGATPNYYPATTNYSYDPWGRRMWKQLLGGLDGNGNPIPVPCEIYFYGATGQKLETYSCLNAGGFSEALEGINIYFGGKLLQAKGVWVARDKLGSVRANSNGETFSYFPYGEERTSTADGREKFATYTRDGFGQDYAQQRYYNANQGAFWTPDPGGIKTANSSDPTSWNRYAYALGDPIGSLDPTGMIACDPDDDDGCLAATSGDDSGGGGGDDGDDDGGDDDGDDDDDPCASSTATFCTTSTGQMPTTGIVFSPPTVAPTIAPTPQPGPGIWPSIGQFITSIPVRFFGVFFTVGQGTMGCGTLACNPTPLYPGPPIITGAKGGDGVQPHRRKRKSKWNQHTKPRPGDKKPPNYIPHRKQK